MVCSIDIALDWDLYDLNVGGAPYDIHNELAPSKFDPIIFVA